MPRCIILAPASPSCPHLRTPPYLTRPPLAPHSYVWGRGALDVKVTAIAMLEAVRSLLAQGFSPQQTYLFAFGHDEEVGGEEGAGHISALLQQQGVTQLEVILDEGGQIQLEGFQPFTTYPTMIIGTAEKVGGRVRCWCGSELRGLLGGVERVCMSEAKRCGVCVAQMHECCAAAAAAYASEVTACASMQHKTQRPPEHCGLISSAPTTYPSAMASIGDWPLTPLKTPEPL